MWKKINSPIVITIICILTLVVMRSTMKPRLAREVRGVYDEIIAIAKEGKTDAEKTKAVQDFAKEMARQLKSGFKMGFSSANSDTKKESADVKFLRIKDKIEISAKQVPASWNNNESFILTITNNSDYDLKQLRINAEYFQKGEIVDCGDVWINSINILEAGKTHHHKINRSLPKKSKDSDDEVDYSSDSQKFVAINFSVVDKPEKDK